MIEHIGTLAYKTNFIFQLQGPCFKTVEKKERLNIATSQKNKNVIFKVHFVHKSIKETIEVGFSYFQVACKVFHLLGITGAKF